MHITNGSMTFRCLLVSICCLCLGATCYAAIPNADNPDAYTEKDYRLQLFEHYKQTMAGAYREIGSRSEAWDEQVIELLDGDAATFANAKAPNQAKVPKTLSKERREELLAEIKLAGCDDPYVRYLIFRDMDADDEGYLAYAREVYQDILDSGYPLNRKLIVVWMIAGKFQELDQDQEARQAIHTWVDLVCQGVNDPALSMQDQYFLFRRIKNYIDEDWLDRWEPVCERIDQPDAVNPWLVGVICGFYHVEVAWEKRGSGYASTVTDEGRAGFRSHLERARDHLVRATELAPQFPDAFAEMITVSMGLGTGEERLWFDRAVGAQFDHSPAYSSYRWSIRPRWGGSIREVYEFGQECLQTGRFDTVVPQDYYAALQNIADDQGHYGFWTRPGVYEEFVTYYDGRKTETNSSNSPQWLESLKTAVAWRAGRYSDCVYLMKRLGEDLSPRTFEYFDGDRLLGPSEAYARVSVPQATFDEARTHWSKEKYRAAAETLGLTVDDMEINDPARPYLRHLTVWAQRLHQDNQDVWVDLLGQPDLAGWKNHGGVWSVDEQGRLTGLSEGDEGLALANRFNMGHHLIIRGQLTLLETTKPQIHNGGVLLSYRKKSNSKTMLHREVLFYDEWNSVIISQNFKYDRWGHDAEIGKTNTFQIEMWGQNIRITVNDQVVCENHRMRYQLPDEVFTFAIGGWYDYPGGSVRFDEVKAKRLHQKPSWVDADNPHK